MHALRDAIGIAWILFWIYWFVSAAGVKPGRASRRRLPFTGISAIAVIVLLRVFHGNGSGSTSIVLGVAGATMFAAGVLLAIWARLHLGRNWGMPMTQKDEPELVTSGPYRLIRHPIYSGLILAMLGTALLASLVGLVIPAILGAYFYYSATVEERNLAETFPVQYAAYREHTKMLVPYVL